MCPVVFGSQLSNVSWGSEQTNNNINNTSSNNDNNNNNYYYYNRNLWSSVLSTLLL